MQQITWLDDTYCYVSFSYGADGVEPFDCYTRVGYSWRIDSDALDSDADYSSAKEAAAAAAAAIVQVWWYDDGDDDNRDLEGPYDTREDAHEAAISAAEDADEGEGGEDADSVARRILLERAGDPDPEGEYCVLWETIGDDSHVVARYSTAEAAEAAAELAQRRLEASHPGGRLMCGYAVYHDD
jgi:hypothetical protein